MRSAAEQPVTEVRHDGGPPPVPPTVELFGLFTGMVVTRLIDFVGRWEIAGRLRDGPKTSVDLAEAAGVHEPS
jgi:hypothetical protein